jgi:hypothetical protein
LTEFGGLHVVQDGPGRDLRRRPLAIDATLVTGTQPPRLDEDGKTIRQSPQEWRRSRRMAPLISRDEAELIAEKWVNDSAPAGVSGMMWGCGGGAALAGSGVSAVAGTESFEDRVACESGLPGWWPSGSGRGCRYVDEVHRDVRGPGG